MRDLYRPGRSVAMSANAMIATSHPLSTATGLAVLREGGNAVDAAIAAVATQCVVEPHMTGIGGDCFCLYAPSGGGVIALNGSGRAPAAASAEALAASGVTEIDRASPHAVTVPGAISAWTRLHRDHGALPLERLFRDAIAYARDGYPVTARVASDWAIEAQALGGDEHARALFLPGGSAPREGDRHAQPALAKTLTAVARDGAGAFYRGAAAEAMVARLEALGGVHTLDDFANGEDAAFYVEPISSTYAGYDVFECPPNGQGVAALMILDMLGGFDLGPDVELADRIHLHAEAAKLAYHHRDALIGDPACSEAAVETLLSSAAADTLRRRIDRRRAGAATLWTEAEHADTVCLSVVDRDGNAISFINSLFDAFGSTRLEPETGVLLHCRGRSFNLRPGHPNALGPNRRPMHTIIPGMLMKDGKAAMPFGVMGGHYQAAGHAWFLSGLLDRRLDLQSAIDAPRSFAFDGVLDVEPTIDVVTRERLAALGHRLNLAAKPIGGAQAIWIDREKGLLLGGSDCRKDGMALGY